MNIRNCRAIAFSERDVCRDDALVCKQVVPVSYLVLLVVNCSPIGLASG